jgi:hypothetical protein
MNYIEIIPTYQRKKSIPKQLNNLELLPENESFSKLTSPIVSKDDLRPVMMGSFFDIKNKNIVSTDANKLTSIKMPIATYNYITKNFVKELKETPNKSDGEKIGLIFKNLKDITQEYNYLVKVSTIQKDFDLEPFDIWLKSRQIEDGVYPKYLAVFPQIENYIFSKKINYSKLFWYCKVLVDAKIIADKSLIKENKEEYEKGKIESLKDSYVDFLKVTLNYKNQKIKIYPIILKFTTSEGVEYISINADLLTDVLRFAMELNGTYEGEMRIFSATRGVLFELEDGGGLNISNNDSVGLLMPIMKSIDLTIGDVVNHDEYKMYYDLDNDTILSDDITYEIDESIGYNVKKSKQVSNTNIAPKMQDINYEKMETLKLIAELKELSEFENAKEKKITMLLISDLRELVEFM